VQFGSRPRRSSWSDLRAEVEQLRARGKSAIVYVRNKVDQLLKVIGTLPLRS
jgi:hypothetical protein